MAAVNPAAILFLMSELYERLQSVLNDNAELRQELDATRAQVPPTVTD